MDDKIQYLVYYRMEDSNGIGWYGSELTHNISEYAITVSALKRLKNEIITILSYVPLNT